MHSRFWPGTRTYMMSGRTNPIPKVYTASLTTNGITRAEKTQLVTCVQSWPGGNATIKTLTVADINAAVTID